MPSPTPELDLMNTIFYANVLFNIAVTSPWFENDHHHALIPNTSFKHFP